MWNSDRDRIEFGLIHSSRRSKEAGKRVDFGDYEIERGVQNRLLDELLVAEPALRFTPTPEQVADTEEKFGTLSD